MTAKRSSVVHWPLHLSRCVKNIHSCGWKPRSALYTTNNRQTCCKLSFLSILPPCCNLGSLYVCMAKTIYLFSFVETPGKSIIAKLCKAFFIISSISTDEDPSLRIESFAMMNLRGVSTKLNKYFVATCQQVTTNLSISSCCHKSVKIRLFATCHLQTCYNLLKQLAASLWITSFENQLATDMSLTSCRKPCEPILISPCR